MPAALPNEVAALARDEDAWFRHDPRDDSVTDISKWLGSRAVISSVSGNPLADEEDAWARR